MGLEGGLAGSMALSKSLDKWNKQVSPITNRLRYHPAVTRIKTDQVGRILLEVMSMARENKVLDVGDKAPDFELPNAVTGEMVGLADLLGQPLLIYFGRGTW